MRKLAIFILGVGLAGGAWLGPTEAYADDVFYFSSHAAFSAQHQTMIANAIRFLEGHEVPLCAQLGRSARANLYQYYYGGSSPRGRDPEGREGDVGADYHRSGRVVLYDAGLNPGVIAHEEMHRAGYRHRDDVPVARDPAYQAGWTCSYEGMR